MPKGLKNLINLMDDTDPPSPSVSSGVENLDRSNTSSNFGGITSPIKHIPFPEIQSGSELVNELTIFLFSIFAAIMQFIHIYRTVFWQPETYINHTVNLYLIDPYLVIFIIVITSRRFIYCLINKSMEIFYSDKYLKIYKVVAKYCFISVWGFILGSCVMKIYAKHNYLSLFLLLYPLIVYTLIFGPKIEPLLRTTAWEVEGAYLNGYPMHCCSSNPVTIRDEIEILKNDFNNRFKQILFTSVINTYYCTVVPMFFAPIFLYYNIIYTTQFIIFVWVTGFTMLTVFCFPAKYCDILHRAALHLGHWTRMEGSSTSRSSNINTQQPNSWTKTNAWVDGSVVRHAGDLYRSNGPVTSALPGNSSHVRFYKLFHNPSTLYKLLTGAQTLLVIIEISLLFFAVEWHNILSLSFLTLTNHHTLFKVVRDYLVIYKVYAAESSIYDKLNTHSN